MYQAVGVCIVLQCCICDIDSAVQTGYPKQLLHKLYLRKGQCFYHLKQNDEALKGTFKINTRVKVTSYEMRNRPEFSNGIFRRRKYTIAPYPKFLSFEK